MDVAALKQGAAATLVKRLAGRVMDIDGGPLGEGRVFTIPGCVREETVSEVHFVEVSG